MRGVELYQLQKCLSDRWQDGVLGEESIPQASEQLLQLGWQLHVQVLANARQDEEEAVRLGQGVDDRRLQAILATLPEQREENASGGNALLLRFQLKLPSFQLTVHLVQERHEGGVAMIARPVIEYPDAILVPLLASIQQRFQEGLLSFFLYDGDANLCSWFRVLSVLDDPLEDVTHQLHQASRVQEIRILNGPQKRVLNSRREFPQFRRVRDIHRLGRQHVGSVQAFRSLQTISGDEGQRLHQPGLPRVRFHLVVVHAEVDPARAMQNITARCRSVQPVCLSKGGGRMTALRVTTQRMLHLLKGVPHLLLLLHGVQVPMHIPARFAVLQIVRGSVRSVRPRLRRMRVVLLHSELLGVHVQSRIGVVRRGSFRSSAWGSINFQRRLAFQGSHVIIIVIVSFLRNRIPHLLCLFLRVREPCNAHHLGRQSFDQKVR